MDDEKPIFTTTYPSERVLEWSTGKNTLRQTLVDTAGEDAGGDLALGDNWWGRVLISNVLGVYQVNLYSGQP